MIYAVRLAQRNDSNVILFRAFELPELVRQLRQNFSCESDQALRNLFDDATGRSEERLVALSRDVQLSNLKIETSHRLGAPYEEIVKVAREREVDLIVIATHGYTGLKHGRWT